MLGTGAKHIKFHSPQGDGERLKVFEQDNRALSLRDCITAFEAERGYRHSLEQYHFSINAEEVDNMDSPMVYVNGDVLVATLAKVGGS
jgi:hypothetical protein